MEKATQEQVRAYVENLGTKATAEALIQLLDIFNADLGSRNAIDQLIYLSENAIEFGKAFKIEQERVIKNV